MSSAAASSSYTPIALNTTNYSSIYKSSHKKDIITYLNWDQSFDSSMLDTSKFYHIRIAIDISGSMESLFGYYPNVPMHGGGFGGGINRTISGGHGGFGGGGAFLGLGGSYASNFVTQFIYEDNKSKLDIVKQTLLEMLPSWKQMISDGATLQLSIITFDDVVTTIINKIVSVTDIEELYTKICSIRARGSTDIYTATQTLKDMSSLNPEGVEVVNNTMILTDGYHNIGMKISSDIIADFPEFYDVAIGIGSAQEYEVGLLKGVTKHENVYGITTKEQGVDVMNGLIFGVVAKIGKNMTITALKKNMTIKSCMYPVEETEDSYVIKFSDVYIFQKFLMHFENVVNDATINISWEDTRTSTLCSNVINITSITEEDKSIRNKSYYVGIDIIKTLSEISKYNGDTDLTTINNAVTTLERLLSKFITNTLVIAYETEIKQVLTSCKELIRVKQEHNTDDIEVFSAQLNRNISGGYYPTLSATASRSYSTPKH